MASLSASLAVLLAPLPARAQTDPSAPAAVASPAMEPTAEPTRPDAAASDPKKMSKKAADSDDKRAATKGRLRHDGSKLARAAAAEIESDASIVARDALSIRVSSSGGIVTLSGTAGTIFDREQAARGAERTDGVRGIHPSIIIRAPRAIDPSALEAAVKQAVIDAGAAGPTFAVKASADGTVQLNGEVNHEWSAVNAVKKVPGVTAIGGYEARLPGKIPPKAEAELTVVSTTPEQDSALAAKVKEALKAAGLDKITVAVERGIVRLSGHAAGHREAIAASRVAATVGGILGVESTKLTIPGRAFRADEIREPQVVERDVRRRVRSIASAKGDSYRIGDLRIHVSGGKVVLSGRARSEDAAYSAVEAASSVGGVQEVLNALTYPTLAHSS